MFWLVCVNGAHTRYLSEEQVFSCATESFIIFKCELHLTITKYEEKAKIQIGVLSVKKYGYSYTIKQ